MCERCHQYDDKITRYRRLASRINDRIAQDGIAELIEPRLPRRQLSIPSRSKSNAALRLPVLTARECSRPSAGSISG